MGKNRLFEHVHCDRLLVRSSISTGHQLIQFVSGIAQDTSVKVRTKAPVYSALVSIELGLLRRYVKNVCSLLTVADLDF